MSKAALILLPNVLGKVSDHHNFLPASVDEAVASIDGIIAESMPGARSYLKRFKTKKATYDIPVAILDKKSDLNFLLEPIVDGERWGFISDAGLPCLADPGAKLVARARKLDLEIEAHPGPSSITMAIMLSGLPCQHFAFLGYLSKFPDKRKKEITFLIRDSAKNKATQIFIEAPYRNDHTLADLLEILGDRAILCVAWDLTLSTQEVISMPVGEWKKIKRPSLAKKPAIFLFYSER